MEISIDPGLFGREGHVISDGKGGVIYVDPSSLECNNTNRKQSITSIVKLHLRELLKKYDWYYIYAYDGNSFTPIINTTKWSHVFSGGNAPFKNLMDNGTLCARPISSE